MLEFSRKHLAAIAWSLVAAANLTGLIIWGDTLSWDAGNLNSYTVFPLLGLIAFNTMWAQYAAGAIRRLAGVDKPALSRFSNLTGIAVTSAILLHPALLIWQLWRDGDGLPPGSSLNYVNPALKWAVLLGMLSLLVFLAFELRHRFREYSWWKYVDYANDAAIVAIYIHAFNIGSHTHLSWFLPLWVFYGITLSAAIIHKHAAVSRRSGWIVAGLLLVAFSLATVAAKASSNNMKAASGAESTQLAGDDQASTSNEGSDAYSSNSAPSSAPATNVASPVANPAANTITIKADGFAPANLTVKKGSPVIWQNSDTQEHAIDPAPGQDSSTGPHSQPLKTGESYTYSFKDKGEYKYIDVMYPDHGGIITVTD